MPDEQPATSSTHLIPASSAGQGRRVEPEHGPVDPDVDLRAPGQRREWTANRWLLPSIAVGGMIGASARHALELAWPVTAGAFPWATFVTNVAGCALIGVMMVYVVELGAGHPLVRPFVGVGILGGFTTFSTYAVQTTDLMEAHQPALALSYFFGTVAAAVASVTLGVNLGRLVLPWLHARGHRARSGTAAVR